MDPSPLSTDTPTFRLPIAPEGYVFIAMAFVAAWLVPQLPFLHWLKIPLWAFFVFVVAFFRDFERTVPPGDRLIICPADGRVVKIDEIDEPTFMKGRCRMVAIFMSPFHCHVNRAPMAGQVQYVQYNPGQFEMAFREKASELNEQNSVGLVAGEMRILVRQIAGFLARRIVCYVKPSDQLHIGQRFGMIRFGSRVDLFLPLDVDVRVHIGDEVRAGTTIIGTHL